MTEKKEDETTPERSSGLRFVEPRHWADDDVMAAVEFLKRERPQVWAELEELERATGSIRGSDAADLQFGALSKLYPECSFSEISDLAWQVRFIRRAALGLEF
ncbi:hypothetical protein [Agrobacterium tumefaciens]|uniref:hypothetical protein n=1 Tax=Agrobacterium tumefaciens TaxID=358 RepID=UPI00059FEB46|nr:hypothetical protein [Agrobacterium tumefaciens]